VIVESMDDLVLSYIHDNCGILMFGKDAATSMRLRIIR
jgi:hypothetical protein